MLEIWIASNYSDTRDYGQISIASTHEEQAFRYRAIPADNKVNRFSQKNGQNSTSLSQKSSEKYKTYKLT